MSNMHSKGGPVTLTIPPEPKSPAIDALLTSLTGRSRLQCIADHTCMTCGQPAEQFSNQLSVKEYAISGMCQKCQDSVFGVGDTEDTIYI